MQAPLMFVRGGSVEPGYSLGNAGDYGRYWSSVSYGSSYAYALIFSSGNVYPSYGSNRYLGYSLRCVALGG